MKIVLILMTAAADLLTIIHQGHRHAELQYNLSFKVLQMLMATRMSLK